MNSTNNYSDIKFGINNDAERISWTAYFLFGVLSSLIGDSLILYASYQRDAFKINRILVIIIRHIAVSDLASTINRFLPISISLVTKSWILGDVLCYVVAYTSYFTYLAGMSHIAVLTTSKFLLLRYPLRVASWSKKRVNQVCSFVWAFTLITPICFFVVDKDDVNFDNRIYSCEYGFTSDAWKRIVPISVFIFAVVPNMVIVATSVPTLMYLVDATRSARRVQGSIPWQGALTVTLTAAVFCISTLPITVHHITGSFVKNPSDSFLVHFYRLCYFLMMINIAANFYIYVLTINSFQRFLFSKLSIFPVSVETSNTVLTSTAIGEEQRRKTISDNDSPSHKTSLRISKDVGDKDIGGTIEAEKMLPTCVIEQCTE